MSKDAGITPGIVERAFRKSTASAYQRLTSQQQAKAGVADRETKAERLRGDLEALEAIQSSRPMKPPGRR